MVQSLIAWTSKLPDIQFEITAPEHRVAISVSIEIVHGREFTSLCGILESEANDFAKGVRKP